MKIEHTLKRWCVMLKKNGTIDCFQACARCSAYRWNKDDLAMRDFCTQSERVWDYKNVAQMNNAILLAGSHQST